MLDIIYLNWINEVKTKIRSSQMKAMHVVNSIVIEFYWDLGKMITANQTVWGTKFLEKVSKDLKEEFPDMKGFSTTNLKYCKLFYQRFLVRPQLEDEMPISNRPQLEDEYYLNYFLKIPWGHTKVIIDKTNDAKEALFYASKTIENNWSRDVLALQIKSNLYERNGKAISNFQETLPEPFSDLAQQTLKDPYLFDFVAMTKPYVERDIENQLVNHIRKFLLELGKGFAFVGQQYHLEITGNDYYIDLLFYHIKLKCFVVIELKNTKFIPEYAGKLNFYLSAVDSLLKDENDNPTIGIILCREKNNIEAEFALRGINKPMGVSEFDITEKLPENLKSSLPTIEEIESELNKPTDL